MCAFSQAFHGTGGGNRDCGNKETCADDPESFGTRCYGFRGVGEKVHKLCGGQETDDGSKKHDHTAGFQCQPENFFHTFHFPGTEVVADQRTHSLNDTIGRKIQEGL